jgi:hypothetical protein
MVNPGSVIVMVGMVPLKLIVDVMFPVVVESG